MAAGDDDARWCGLDAADDTAACGEGSSVGNCALADDEPPSDDGSDADEGDDADDYEGDEPGSADGPTMTATRYGTAMIRTARVLPTVPSDATS